MSINFREMEQAPSLVPRSSLATSTLPVPAIAAAVSDNPAVMIKGETRLRVSASRAAHGPVRACFTITTEALHGPLHVIWQTEGRVLNHDATSIEVAFDVRGVPAGHTSTFVLAVQVTDEGGQGRIVKSGTFVQITVTQDDPSPGEHYTSTVL